MIPSNLLLINKSKCYYTTLITRKYFSVNCSYNIDDVILKKETLVRNQGITLDTNLAFKPHIFQSVNVVRRMLSCIIKNSGNLCILKLACGYIFTGSRTILSPYLLTLAATIYYSQNLRNCRSL